MKMDDLNISELKKKFAHHLKSLKSLTPEGFEELTKFIINLGDKIKEYTENPDKTQQDYEKIEELSKELQAFIIQLSEVQIKLQKKDWEDTEAYYNSLKQKADQGDTEAKQVLKDFEPVYFELKERMKSNQSANLSLAYTSSLLESIVKS